MVYAFPVQLSAVQSLFAERVDVANCPRRYTMFAHVSRDVVHLSQPCEAHEKTELEVCEGAGSLNYVGGQCLPVVCRRPVYSSSCLMHQWSSLYMTFHWFVLAACWMCSLCPSHHPTGEKVEEHTVVSLFTRAVCHCIA